MKNIILIISVVVGLGSCTSENEKNTIELNVQEVHINELNDLDLINSLYSDVLAEDCYLSRDTLYCNLSFKYDDKSYEEVLTSMLIVQGRIKESVKTFIYKYSESQKGTINVTKRNSGIVDWSLSILPLENELFELYNYIIRSMIPSDLQVYTNAMNHHEWGEVVEEFEDEFFMGLLIKGYTGEINRNRFHDLLDLYIDWSIERSETEKPDHFIYFKELFPIHDFGDNDFYDPNS